MNLATKANMRILLPSVPSIKSRMSLSYSLVQASCNIICFKCLWVLCFLEWSIACKEVLSFAGKIFGSVFFKIKKNYIKCSARSLLTQTV